MKGRQILDVVLISNEMVNEYKIKMSEGAIFQINMDKA